MKDENKEAIALCRSGRGISFEYRRMKRSEEEKGNRFGSEIPNPLHELSI